MSTQALAVLVLLPVAAVVAAIFAVMWRERRSEADARTAVVAGSVVAAGAVLTTVLAARGAFVLPDALTMPPVAIDLAVVLLAMGASLAGSSSLRRLLTNQRSLILLNVWRLEGIVFLLLAIEGQVPALWALPAGIGDVIVGATALAVASGLDRAGGRQRAIAFNVFGLADLIVAVGLGVMTSPGPAQVFQTTPTAALLTRFPLAVVPTFLVPLAVVLHVVSLWQLSGRPWASPGAPLPATGLGRERQSAPEAG